jgi:hypothetical protein
MYRLLSRVYPIFARRGMKKLLRCSDLKVDVNEFLGFSFIVSVVVALFFGFVMIDFFNLALMYFVVLALVLFLLCQVFFYFLVLFRAEGKARFIESVLPDALQLTASNLKAGFTVERAMLLSARPEFGAFSDELTIIGREIATGKNIEAAMMGMTERVRSEKLAKTIMLIVYGMRSGGELAILLSQIAQNLRTQMLVEERVRTSVLMYFIFILSAVAFAAPVLFALSSFLAEVITKQLSAIDIPAGVAAPITISKVAIGSNFILAFIVTTLITLSVFGSLTLGLIKKGKGKEGVKYIPLLLLFSLGVFFAVRTIVSNLFSGII